VIRETIIIALAQQVLMPSKMIFIAEIAHVSPAFFDLLFGGFSV
jgi:hypothetical protein